MSNIYSTSMRTISPHRKALLTSISSREPSPHRTCPLQTSLLIDHNTTHISAAFSTTSNHRAARSQATYIQDNMLRQNNRSESAGKGRGSRAQQLQSVSKVLHKVHLSSWAKGGLSSIFNGLGNFASKPYKIVEEVGRMLGRSSKRVDEAKEVPQTKDTSDVKVVYPVEEEEIKPQSAINRTVIPRIQDEGAVREQHSFQKAMEDTNDSIVSFYHAYTTPEYLPSKPKLTPRIRATPTPTPSPSPSPKVQEPESSWNIFRNFPLPFSSDNSKSPEKPVKDKPLIRKDFVSRSVIEARTRALVTSLKAASSYTSKITCTQELCKHLKQFPSGRHEATECKVVPVLLKMLQSSHPELKEEAMEALSLLGYTQPVKGRGINILSLDGGGTRGMMTLQCLQKLEEVSNRRVYEMFDYVCGVSTGALIAAMVCLYRLPLEECVQLYMDFSQKMFSRSRVIGTGGLVWNHAFYDSDQWEKILQAELGDKTMIEFSRDPEVPKLSAVSTVMNMPRLKNFVFRNYNLPPSTYSAHLGSCVHKLWEVIRASSAAPGYYEDFRLGDYVHSDGGISTNNPTALAVHESRLLWPNEKIQCVVSVGTGRYEPQVELGGSNKVTLKEKVSKVVDSATDTEGVHVMMNDLMPPGTYFRFNPYLSEDLQLDEIRPERLEGMKRDGAMYLRKNDNKIRKAANTLMHGRRADQHAMDWLKFKVDSYW